MLVFFNGANAWRKKIYYFFQINCIYYPPYLNHSLYLNKGRITAFTNDTHQVQSNPVLSDIPTVVKEKSLPFNILQQVVGRSNSRYRAAY